MAKNSETEISRWALDIDSAVAYPFLALRFFGGESSFDSLRGAFLGATTAFLGMGITGLPSAAWSGVNNRGVSSELFFFLFGCDCVVVVIRGTPRV